MDSKFPVHESSVCDKAFVTGAITKVMTSKTLPVDEYGALVEWWLAVEISARSKSSLLPLRPPGWSMLDYVGHTEDLVTTGNYLSNGMAH